MARNDEGEFELVLGNRQLISVFLIVVVLLGVFFSMGYIVGRNSGAGPTTASNSGKQIVVDHPAVTATPARVTPAEPPPSDASQGTAEVKPSPEGPPASTHPAKSAEPPPAPAHQEAPAPVKVAKEPPPKEKPAPSRPASVTGEPPSGKYWQVVATSRPDAEIISEALNKKGFHAMLTPAPKDGIFRVLVGPVNDPSALAQTRSDLEASGFKNPIMRKY